jgi:ribosome biogenesis protein ERB1
MGYTVKGEKVAKGPEKDELDEFMRRQNDPNWWRNIHDYLNQKDVRLSKGDMQLILRIRQGLSAKREFDPFENPIEHDPKKYIHPYMPTQEPKRKFQPSKWERIKVNKFVKALKKGWMKTTEQKRQEEEERRKQEEKAWDIWEDESIVTWQPRKMPKQIQAPKRDLPSHAESYNPADEYLLDDDEKKEQTELDPEDQMYNFDPSKYDSLRKVPLYQNLIKEHFERCLDLYMSARVMKKKVNVQDLSSLIPELPSPSELKPFPQKMSIEYKFHESCVRSISVSPCGQYLASCDVSGNLVIWQVETTRIIKKYKLDKEVIDCVAWCPSKQNCILAVCNEDQILLFAPRCYNKFSSKMTDDLLEQMRVTW